MRKIIRNDFAKTRDLVLSNFTTPQFDNHTFIVYGNRYHYPIIVNQKESIDYFLNDQEEFRYYTSMFKTPEQLQMRENLIYFGIGEKRFNQFSPNTGDNLINAELEFKANHHNSLYDFTSVILKYTKSFEYEIILIKYDFLKYNDVEFEKRNHGENLKSTEYITQVNERRIKHGFLPMDQSGYVVEDYSKWGTRL